MDTYIYKLKFRSPLHISSDPMSLGAPEIFLHSDTLFSALLNSFVNLYPADESFVKNPPFVISSAFPFYKDTLFIKKPYVRLPIKQEVFEHNRKKVKKTAFISLALFEELASGREITISEENFLDGGFLSDSIINEKIYTVQERPRSSVARNNSKTDIFYTTAVHFSEHAGLYFFASFENENIKKQFDSALYLLGDTGIGGNRSNGYGLFNVLNVEKFENPFTSGDYSVALSLYHPKKEEVENGILEDAHFSVTSRQSWIFAGSAEPYRSKRVKMFEEGSVFSGCSAEGDVVDITPAIVENIHIFNHRIYRFGKLFKFCLPEKALEVKYE